MAMNKIVQRTLISFVLLGVFGLSYPGFGTQTILQAAPNKTAKELRIATQPGPHYAPIFVAKKKGWLERELKKAKVTVKWTTFLAGPPMNEAFAAGEEDIGLLGDTPAIIARAAGQNIRVVGLASSGPKALAIVVRKNARFTSAKELKGRKVAVTKGSYAHHLLALVLQNNGLTTEDIRLINLPVADIGTALINGDIDAGAIWEPHITKLEESGTIRVLVDGTDIKKGVLVIITPHQFAADNPTLVTAFLKAYQRGYDFVKANPVQAAELIADEAKLTPEQLLKVFAKFDYYPRINPDDIAELKKSEEFMRANEIIKTRVNIDDFVDTRYLEAAGIK
jgi:sulfonate transport system substrate-binding protein